MIITFALVFTTGCANAQSPMRLEVDGAKLQIMRGTEEVASFEIEIADTEERRSAGLMFRTDLPDNRGMLFVFGDENLRFFWMKNTPTPLDIIYANAAGKIVHVAKRTVPFSTMPIPSQKPAKFALEVIAGQTDAMNIVIGDNLVHPAIKKN